MHAPCAGLCLLISHTPHSPLLVPHLRHLTHQCTVDSLDRHGSVDRYSLSLHTSRSSPTCFALRTGQYLPYSALLVSLCCAGMCRVDLVQEGPTTLLYSSRYRCSAVSSGRAGHLQVVVNQFSQCSITFLASICSS